MKAKCVDDVLLHDDGIEESFYHTIDYLVLSAKNGVVKSRAKFQFCRDDVEFAVWNWQNLGWFPRNLCCQLLKAFLLRETSQMLGHGLAWSTRLPGRIPWVQWCSHSGTCYVVAPNSIGMSSWMRLFEKSKSQVVALVREVIATFDVNRTTCLAGLQAVELAHLPETRYAPMLLRVLLKTAVCL